MKTIVVECPMCDGDGGYYDIEGQKMNCHLCGGIGELKLKVLREEE